MREVMDAIRDTGAIAHTLETARKHARIAKESLEVLPENRYRRALEGLTEFAVARTS